MDANDARNLSLTTGREALESEVASDTRKLVLSRIEAEAKKGYTAAIFEEDELSYPMRAWLHLLGYTVTGNRYSTDLTVDWNKP